MYNLIEIVGELCLCSCAIYNIRCERCDNLFKIQQLIENIVPGPILS